MATERGVENLLSMLQASGLDWGPKGDPRQVVSTWASMLDHPDITDGMLVWAAKKWQENGNTNWPKPMEIRNLVADQRNRVAEKRMEDAGEKGCYRCAWTGTRTVVRHLLLLKEPISPADADLLVRYFLSDDPSLHSEVGQFVLDNPKIAGEKMRTFVVRCDCGLGSLKQNLLPYQEYSQKNPPVREPGPAWKPPTAVACRQYVTGTGKRYHPDDTRPREQGTTTVRWYNSPSPEELNGPVEGHRIRENVAKGGSHGAKKYIVKAMGRR